MDYYEAHVGMPEIGFSPDGDFPMISCEKTILHLTLTLPAPRWIKSWQAGTRPNVVPALSTLTIDRDADFDGNEKTVADGAYTFVAHGVAAHGMCPEQGDNAIWKNAALLRSLGDSGVAEFDRLLTLMSPYALDILGVNCEDEQSGNQTINIGVIDVQNGVATVTVDMRCPVVQNTDKVLAAFREYLGCTVKELRCTPYLFADRNSELFQKLYSAFTDVYGKEIPPVISGGGTYARHMPCGVAFGPTLPGSDFHIHDRDEFLPIADLDFMIDVYVEAIRRLATTK